MHASPLRIAVLAALLAPAGAFAQAEEPTEPRQSPRDWAFHLQFGGYYPQIDEQAGLSDAPFQRVFGDSNRTIVQAGLERYLFDAFGTLGLGLSLGYSEFYGRGFFAEGPDAGERSGDSTSFTVVPIQAYAAYRFDVLAQAFNVPLVPYAKAGVGTWMWFTGGESGQRGGFSYGGGMQLLLDFFDPRLAREFDREVGVNNSYFFVDWAAWQVDGFGDSEGFDLSDDGIVSFGLALDF
jgi:hypothetical protein